MNSSQENEEKLLLIAEALKKAHTLLQEGVVNEAEQYFMAVLDLMPDHPEANYNIGLLYRRKNLPLQALSHFEIALDNNPEHGPYWIAYIDTLAENGQREEAAEILALAEKAGLSGQEVEALSKRMDNEKTGSGHPVPNDEQIAELIALYEKKQFSECESLARKFLTAFPESGIILKILGAVLKQQDRTEEALDIMLQAVNYLPGDSQLLNNLGIVLENSGFFSESEKMLHRAISLDPNFAEAYNNLGVTFRASGKLEAAEQAFREAIRLHAAYVEAHGNLGITLKDLGRLAEAEKSIRKALELNSQYTDGYNNLGNVLHSAGKLAEAEQNFNKALDLNGNSAVALNNLGNTLHCLGELDRAEECYRSAINLDPEYTEPFDGLLFISNYQPDLRPEELYSLYEEYNSTFGLPMEIEWKPHENNPSMARRLRVGYVSPAFYRHSVFNFLEPLLANHDTSSFELFAYSETIRDDDIADHYKQYFHHWIPTVAYSDDRLAERIRADRIDILVDLAGHTGRNRLGVFARKPAPVSLHWLDFGYTTGLTAIDYYLTDPYCVPFGSEKYFSEKIWRLTVPSFVYRPTENMGPVGDLPAETNNFITFGTLTRAIRLNHKTIRLWSQLLKRVRDSRLIIDSGNFKDIHAQQKLLDRFLAHGIENERIKIGFHSPPWDILRQIDISLDCFPHNSGTTLFESLYMGIPYITLADRPGVGRIGSSILQGINHPEWIASSEEEYLEKAVQLASDTGRLSHLRKNLRREMETGPLMDHPGFTAQVEDAYRSMFKIWINRHGRTKSPDHIKQDTDNHIAPEAASLFNRGVDCLQEKQTENAKNLFIKALNIQNNFADAWNNLGVVFQQQGNFPEAENCLAYALQIKPEYTDALLNLANTHKIQHNLSQAEKYYRKVLALQDDYHLAVYNLGNILQEQGRHLEAEKYLRKAIDLKPDHINAYSTLLFTLNYDPDIPAEKLFAEYRNFDHRFCIPLRNQWRDHNNSTQKNRRLKIAYCAADYRKHPARYFIIPLLAHHDKKSFQIYSYVAVPDEEANSDIFYDHVDNWSSTTQMSDQQLADTIRKDEIDILIDLAGHTAGNRLLVFARKPAPVSLHWLDFGYTTGLSAVDYYLTDKITVPPGSEHLFSEKPWYIDTPAQAYRPPTDTGPVTDLPARKNNFITFGTLTRAVRINYKTIRTWATILHEVPDSQLVINSGSFNETSMQQRIEQQFLDHGINKERLKIGCDSPPWGIFRKIDISLDCFPHNSGTTLVESLYMGVPFITLAARPGMGRIGSSILYGVNRPDWIAKTEDEYIRLAIQLASDIDALSQIRENLRKRMKEGPMMDEAAFTRRVETACKEMFYLWCDNKNIEKKESEGKKKKRLRLKMKNCPSPKEQRRLTNLFNSGKQQEAIQLARSLIKKYPENGFSWKILGPLLFQQGQIELALQAMKRAADLLPEDPDVHFNLAIGLEQAGKLEDSVNWYQSTLRLKPDNSQACYNLGNVFLELEKLDEAITAYNTALQLQPNLAEAQNNLGRIFQKKEEPAKAESCYLKALELDPSMFITHYNLGLHYLKTGHLAQAESCYQRAIALAPDFVDGLRSMGSLMQKQGRFDDSIEYYKKALKIRPDDVETLNNLAFTLHRQGFDSKAESICRQVINMEPDYVKAYNNLGNILLKKGQLSEAEHCFRRSLELDPDHHRTFGNILFLLNYHPQKTSEEIFKEYNKFNELFKKPLINQWTGNKNNYRAGRRLKIGYVGSSQFRNHSARHCLEPLLEHHDRQQYELFAYAELYSEDNQTRRYRNLMEHWFVTTGLSDQRVVDQIRKDGIDVLVDLAGHTEGNRLGVFALKPAPVSLHWLDFGYTTGLTAIDYFLTDEYIVPPDGENFFTEKVWRLENPSLAYRPASGMGDVSPLPAQNNGYVTFGTLTRAIRINDRTIRVWAEILRKVKGSRLIVDSGDFKDNHSRKDLQEKFAALGIDRARLDIGFHTPPWDILRSMDIALDCFPHNSGTTLFEHLYMGIPYITLKDRPSVGRLGSAILAGIGHYEWAADTEEEYIKKASMLARNLDDLSKIRSTLRQEMENSPLMDEAGFTLKMETAYSTMFDNWYAQKNREHKKNRAIDELFRSADSYSAAEEYDLAGNIYMDILKTQPDNPHAHYCLGTLAMKLGQPETALPYFQKAVDVAPTEGRYWLSCIDAFDRCGKSDTALQLLEMAIEAGLSDDCLPTLKQRIEQNITDHQDNNREKPELFSIKPDEEKRLITLFQKGELPECEEYARQLIEKNPEYVLGYKALGLTLHNTQKTEEAIPVLEKALSLSPEDLEISHLLAEIYFKIGQMTEAEKIYLDSLHYHLQSAESYLGLANVQVELNKHDEAKNSYLKALEHNPNLTDAHVNLGNLLQHEGFLSEAEECFTAAQELAPDYTAPFFNHANLMRVQGRLKEAEKLYKNVIKIDRNHLQAYSNLGITLQLQGRLQEAEKWYDKALNIRPDFIEALVNSGACLKEQGRYVESENRYKTALEIEPDFALCLSNLGSVLKEQGKIDEAETCLRKAVELNPDFSQAHSNLLFLLNYHPDKSAEEIYEEYSRFNQKFGTPPKSATSTTAICRELKKRKLKLGYVSPQFKKHSTRHFLEPLLANHNKRKFEIFLYAEQTAEDEYSKRYRSYADHWITTVKMDDDELAERIREDKIDILIDIAGHTSHNRLLMFTRKPAPVSLHWLDYGYTTGLTAIDYYLADEAIVPPGTDHLFSETVWRLKSPCFAYKPAEHMGEVNALPALKNKTVTFGTLTRAVRINKKTINAWSDILKQVENSRLIIDSNNFRSREMQQSIKKQFAARGISPDRVEVGFHSPPWDLMRQIDICLDCFPHNSGTTLFETLYMGIPFITLADRPATGRLGCTILTGLGNTEWIAFSKEEYIRLAVDLASDIQKLAKIRSELREKMTKSRLMDEKGFTRRMEKAYLEMFEEKCGNNGAKTKTRKQNTGKKHRKRKKQKPGKTGRKQSLITADEMDRLTRLYQQGNMREAEATARSLIKLYPDNAQVWKILGAIHRHFGCFQEALEAMKKSVFFSPEDYICLRNIGVILCDLGQYGEAEKFCRKALKIAPRYPEAFNSLGSSLRSQGRYEEAEKAFKKALKLAPDNLDSQINLALVLNETGRYEEAETIYNQVLELYPDSAECYCGLSLTLLSLERMDEAESACEKALELKPEYPGAHNSLGTILHGQGRFDEAEVQYRKAIQAKPGYSEALHNLGKTLASQDRIDEAITCYQQVVKQNPDHPEAWFNMGNCFADKGEYSQAASHYEKGLARHPDDRKSWLNHGNACKKLGLLPEAEKSYRKALEIDPDYIKALNNLGNILQEQARFNESEKAFRKVLKNSPDSQDAFSNLLFLLNYHPDKTGEEIFFEYKLFDQKFGLPHLPETVVFRNDRHVNRRLKIGYVSPRFCKHPILNFLEPLLANHNKKIVELYGYSDLHREDEVTARYRTYMDHWRDTEAMGTREMASLIMEDEIDILVDLAGHTEHNRLAVFARKPAPVSLHWLDFGYTTGLSAINYYLADDAVVPPGSEHLFAETPWRLNRPSFAYRPTPGMGEVNDLPAKRNGYITFGCLSRAVRLNHKTIRTWSKILLQVKSSRLVLNSGSFADPEMQENMAARFAEHGIERNRLEIGYTSPPWDVFRSIDIGFDCFPHNSGTTLYETLYMGIPFITLAGRPSVGRLGSTILEGVGHPEWIARNEKEYIDITIGLTDDLEALGLLRNSLRPQMEKSLLMNEKDFADKVEKAYQQMFLHWCEENP